MTIPDRNHFIYLIFVFLLIFSSILLYANSLNAPFIFDDFNSIVKNTPEIQIKELTFSELKEAAFNSQGKHRPLANLTLAVNYYFGGKNTFGYHMVNIFIHILTGVFLFFLFLAILKIPVLIKGGSEAEKEKMFWPGWIAFVSALIWMIHPLQTNAVTYIVQRMSSLSAMFFILSMLLYIHGRTLMRQRRLGVSVCFFSGCFFSGICAVASKENAATLPLFIFLFEWFFMQDLRSIKLRTILVGGLISVAIFWGMALFFLGAHPVDRILAGYGHYGFNLSERVLTEFRVVAYYFSLMVFPHPDRLMLDYDYPISHSFIDPGTTVISALMVLLVFFTAVYSAKKHRLLAFCFLWFLGNLVIESSVIGIEIIYEHRLYLPSMMIFLLLTYAGYKTIPFKWARGAVVVAVLLTLSFWTYQRNQVWRSDVGFWKDCARKSPNDARPLQNIAYSLQQKDLHEEAVAYYRQSLDLEKDPGAFYNMGISLSKIGYHLEAVTAFNQAVELNYDATDMYGKLAYELTMMGAFEGALKNYQHAIGVDPDNQKAKDDLNALSAFLRRCRTPATCLLKLSKQYPENPELQFKMAYLREGERKIKNAISGYQKVLTLMPESDRQLYLMTLNHLATCFLMIGDMDQAMPLFLKGASLSPADYKFHYQLAALYSYKGDADAAFSWLEKAVDKGFSDPDRFESDTRFNGVRDEPRFKRLKNTMGTRSE
ncbi:MAG: hypothetical protein PF482_01275 [Desulfobacteraceae bacterium]|jgi:tetratricopeptide (TPR) repeat protein|nr:hypothetical protein [Desulfobacteraceae bacterium]